MKEYELDCNDKDPTQQSFIQPLEIHVISIDNMCEQVPVISKLG